MLGFVYYETDCFAKFKNPYIPLDVDNPTCHQWKQRELDGEGLTERQELVEQAKNLVRDFVSAEIPDNEDFMAHYEKLKKTEKMKEKEREKETIILEGLLENISREKKRIGGNWAVAGADLKRKCERDYAK